MGVDVACMKCLRSFRFEEFTRENTVCVCPSCGAVCYLADYGWEGEREAKPEWLWCLHCERVYRFGEWKRERGMCVCPWCGASSYLDGWDWNEVRGQNGYPEVPEPGQKYPMYPVKGGQGGLRE